MAAMRAVGCLPCRATRVVPIPGRLAPYSRWLSTNAAPVARERGHSDAYSCSSTLSEALLEKHIGERRVVILTTKWWHQACFDQVMGQRALC